MKKILALAALAALSATASASSNLLVDGSFESISQAPGTWSLVTAPTGWTTTTVALPSVAAGLEVRNNVAGTAQDGSNFIELDGAENDRISQTFATVVGHQYEVSFWFADRAGVAASSEGWLAAVSSGLVSAGSSFGAVGDNGAQWHLATLDFTAASTSSTFSIAAAGKSDAYGTSFDNFSAMAVPEPATLALFAAGLAMIGLSTRRRQR